MGAITNIAPATLESIQLSLATALGTWQNSSTFGNVQNSNHTRFVCVRTGCFIRGLVDRLVNKPNISASVQDYCAVFDQH